MPVQPCIGTAEDVRRFNEKRGMDNFVYGPTELPNAMSLVGVPLTDGDKRLLTLLLTALGPKHPAIEDLISLLLRAAGKEHSK